MKKFNILLIVAATVCLALSSCKSTKSVVGPEATKWQTAELPLKVELTSPMSVSLNGNAYMERGKSAFFVGRYLFGIEIGQAYVTPDQVDLVLKQPQKIWINQEIGNLPVPFDLVQDALLGDEAALSQLASRFGDVVKIGGTQSAPTITISLERKGQKISARLVPNVEQLKINEPLSRRFETPGDAYKKVDAKSALNLLK